MKYTYQKLKSVPLSRNDVFTRHGIFLAWQAKKNNVCAGALMATKRWEISWKNNDMEYCIFGERERLLASLPNLWALEARPANLVPRSRSLQLVVGDLGTSFRFRWSQRWLMETWTRQSNQLSRLLVFIVLFFQNLLPNFGSSVGDGVVKNSDVAEWVVALAVSTTREIQILKKGF